MGEECEECSINIDYATYLEEVKKTIKAYKVSGFKSKAEALLVVNYLLEYMKNAAEGFINWNNSYVSHLYEEQDVINLAKQMIQLAEQMLQLDEHFFEKYNKKIYELQKSVREKIKEDFESKLYI